MQLNSQTIEWKFFGQFRDEHVTEFTKIEESTFRGQSVLSYSHKCIKDPANT